jgi:hypothetical protein
VRRDRREGGLEKKSGEEKDVLSKVVGLLYGIVWTVVFDVYRFTLKKNLTWKMGQ